MRAIPEWMRPTVENRRDVIVELSSRYEEATALSPARSPRAATPENIVADAATAKARASTAHASGRRVMTTWISREGFADMALVSRFADSITRLAFLE